jgi:carbon-monoxide dehydrogenase large subunit
MIGSSPPRKEDRRLLTGAGRVVEDHLGVVRSAEAHARLAGVDLAAVRAQPGVVAAWAAPDLPEAANPVRRSAAGDRPWRQPLLARDAVRYVGEPVAVVVAGSAAALADALPLAAVAYEPRPALIDVERALAAPGIHEGWPDNAALTVRGEVGDVDAALASADVVVEARVRHPRLAAMPIEPRGVLAWRDADTDTLEVWASIQNPYSVRDAIAGALGLDVERVRVRVPDVGGAFGPKGSVYHDEILVALAALRLGRPVRWIESRREHGVAVGHDRDHLHDARIGFRRDGTIVAVDDRFLADVGAYPAEGNGLVANTVNHLPGPYRVPSYRCVGTSVVTTKTLNAAYRGAGRPEAVLVMERLLDLGARRLGLDPAEIRRRNLVRPEEMPYRPGLVYKDGVPVTYDPGDFPAALERLLAQLDYEGWRKRQAAQRGPRRIGIGLGCYAEGTGLGPFEGATVRVDASGVVRVVVGVAAQGQGHATTLAQIAAEALGADLDDVMVVAGDTAAFPYGMGTGGSRVIANAGPAVARSAREVRRKAARVAAELLECAPEDVRIERSRVHVAGVPDRALPLGRVAQAAVRAKALREEDPGLNACTYFRPETVTWTFGAQAVVVEVDVETAAVRLLACAIVHDPGRAVHPAIVEGQLQGGAAQGLGAGLLEAVLYDEAGQPLGTTFMDYALPRAADLPALPVVLAEHRSAMNELGVKGVGESGAIPGAAAVANAVEDALADLGVTVTEPPVTAARLYDALVARARSAGGRNA